MVVQDDETALPPLCIPACESNQAAIVKAGRNANKNTSTHISSPRLTKKSAWASTRPIPHPIPSPPVPGPCQANGETPLAGVFPSPSRFPSHPVSHRPGPRFHGQVFLGTVRGPPRGYFPGKIYQFFVPSRFAHFCHAR